MDIEGLAVSELKRKLSRMDRVECFITERDTGPIIDGYINIYKNNLCKKEDLTGRIYVQIKGKTVSKLKNKISFDVDIADLNGFCIDDGAIFFVVGIDRKNNEKTRIYYNDLLPKKINDILITCSENQKTKSIKLKSLPENSKEILDIFLNFINNSKQQAIMQQSLDKESWDNIEGILTTKIITSNLQNFDPITYWVNNGIYIYKKNKQGISYPIIYNENPEFAISINKSISCNNIIYDEYKEIRKQGERTILLGDNIFIHFEKKDIIFKLETKSDKLSTIIKDIKFFLNLPNYKLVLDGKELNTKNETFNINSDNLQEYLNFLLKVKKSLNLLHLNEDDIPFSLLSVNNFQLANNIISMFINKTIRVTEINNKKFTNFKDMPIEINNIFKLGEIYIPVILTKKEDNLYNVIQFYEFGDLTVSKIGEEKKYPVSKYVLLNKELLLHMKLDFEDLYGDISKFDNFINFEEANKLALNMISVYDVSNNVLFLNYAKKIFEYITNKSDIINYRLNIIQCNKRLNLISENDKSYLLDLLNQNVEDVIKVACYILLDMPQKANGLLQTLSIDNKKMIKDFPIGKFL